MSPNDISSRIFVGGLDHSVNESDLEKAFKIFGDVTHVIVLRDKETGSSRGFAFVSFKDSHSSEDAISRMHGVEIRGRCVSVRHAEKEKHFEGGPRRGFRGGGRGGYSGRGRFDGPSSGSNGYSGGSYRSGGGSNGSRDDYRSNRDDSRAARDDFRYSGNSSYVPRSRSPLGGMPVTYRDESPPRGRRYSGRDNSPPPRREYSPRRATRGDDYYGGARDFSPPPSRARISPARDVYNKYGSSLQALSPARERTAYLSSRGRDLSPPERSDYRVTSDMSSGHGRRAVSPRDSGASRNVPSRREYSSSSREYGGSNAKEYAGSSSTRDYQGSSGRGSYSSSSREFRDDSLSYNRGPQGSRSSGVDRGSDSSRYQGNTESSNRYGSSSSRVRSERMSPPMSKRSSGGGIDRISSRSARHHSPVGRSGPVPSRRY